MLLLDLDNFKQVNDSLGHNAGDELLVTIGGLLRRSVRSTDVVAGLGGDEFAVLLPDGDQAAAETVGRAVVARIRTTPPTLDGVRRRVSASVGAVTFQAAREHAADVLALADMTMYDAKESGRQQVRCSTEGEPRAPRTRPVSVAEPDRGGARERPLRAPPPADRQPGSNDRITSAEVLLRLRDGDELVPPSASSTSPSASG